jgi:hypothetical protein
MTVFGMVTIPDVTSQLYLYRLIWESVYLSLSPPPPPTHILSLSLSTVHGGILSMIASQKLLAFSNSSRISRQTASLKVRLPRPQNSTFPNCENSVQDSKEDIIERYHHITASFMGLPSYTRLDVESFDPFLSCCR